MKAMRWYGAGQPMKYETVDDPHAGVGALVVKVAACGVCHTDLHYLEHGVATFKAPPVILGHEASGTVVEVGAGAMDGNGRPWVVGDRVIIPAVLTCGSCVSCRSGRENICSRMVMLGNHIDGAYAELIAVPGKDVVLLPADLPLEEASIIADAVSTPYHAVKNRAKVRPGETVAVFGCGGVGMNAIQLATAAGASVIAVDKVAKKLEWAKKFGAVATVLAADGQPTSKAIRKMTGGGVEVAFEAIGHPAAMTEAYESVAAGGRLCVIGYSAETVTVSAAKLMFREITVMGSLGCRPVDYPPLVRMVKEGKINIVDQVTHKFPLHQLDEAFKVMKAGEALRSIVRPSTG